MRRNGPLPSMLAATLALAVCAAAGEPDHRLKDYPDLPKITVDGPRLTLVFPDRVHSVVRPLVPKLDLDDYNCYFPGKLDPHVKGGGREVFADPLFEDAERGDFRLKAASPCRDAGADLGLPFHGKAPDLGAFEMQ